MRFTCLSLALVFAFATSVPASAQTTPDPLAVREAQTLMSRFGMDALLQQQVAASRQQLRSMIQAANLGKDAEELIEKYSRLAEEKLQGRLPRYPEEVTLIYVRHFTLQELQQINAFYDSPLGQKLVEKTPILVKECSELGSQMGVDVFREVFEQMLPDLQKRGAKPSPN